MQLNFKNFFLLLTLQLVCGFAFTQKENSEPKADDSEEFVQVIVDEPAEFPGGQQAMKQFINENLKCPEVALKNAITGKCYLRFVVNKVGVVSNAKVVKGISGCPECDAEAIRVLRSMPKWIPAKADGENENYLFSVPISFDCSSKINN